MRNSHEFHCDFFRGENKVYAAARNGALGHVGLLGYIRPLRDGNAADVLDAAQRCRPVTVVTRDNDSDELAVPVFGQRFEEE